MLAVSVEFFCRAMSDLEELHGARFMERGEDIRLALAIAEMLYVRSTKVVRHEGDPSTGLKWLAEKVAAELKRERIPNDSQASNTAATGSESVDGAGFPTPTPAEASTDERTAVAPDTDGGEH